MVCQRGKFQRVFSPSVGASGVSSSPGTRPRGWLTRIGDPVKLVPKETKMTKHPLAFVDTVQLNTISDTIKYNL